MRIRTFKEPTMYRAGAMNELVKEMEKYTVDICAVQEIRWPGKGTVTNKNYIVLFSEHKSDKHEFGTEYCG
jgi:hypothetical protein